MEVLDVEIPFGIAHRGSRILWPENTMVAFAGAVELWYRWLETDLHLTSDGVLVCLHDDQLDRTTDHTGPVWERTWAELDRVDAGYRHAAGDDFPHRGSGVRIPALEEVVTSFPALRLVLELKQDGLAGPLWHLIDRLGLHDRVVVGSFSDRRLARFRALARGTVATSAGPIRSVVALVGAFLGRAPGLADAVQWPEVYGPLHPVTPRTVRGLHRGGFQVHVWTVDDPGEMHRFYDMGVDALISDRPDLLRDVLRSRGAWGER